MMFTPQLFSLFVLLLLLVCPFRFARLERRLFRREDSKFSRNTELRSFAQMWLVDVRFHCLDTPVHPRDKTAGA